MNTESTTLSEAELAVENVGGIDRTSVRFSPGVTVLVGRNATNRTSFLQATMAALGSDDVTIKGDADEASVELTLGDSTYTRRLDRREGGTMVTGDPYFEDPELADLFAFLLESNEARRAVATGSGLRELIMRPVDTEDIEAEIERLIEDREELKQELEEIEERKGELPELEAERTRLEEQIAEKRAELESKEAELEAADADVEETRAENSELEEKLEKLRSKRSSLEDIRFDIETERESLQALQAEREELRAEYEDLPEAPVGEITELDAELDRLRERKQSLNSEVSELQSVIGFNEELLDEAGSGEFAALTTETNEAVTDQLLEDDEVVCWTCGSEVAETQISSTLAQLRERSQTKVSDINDIEGRIDELESEKQEYEHAQRERERIDRRLDTLEADIEETEASIETLRERRDALTDEIETVEAEIEALEDEESSRVLDLHKEANQLEYELGRLESDLERVTNNIAALEDRIATQGDLEAQLEATESELNSLRTKISRIEDGAIEQFNDHMDTVLDLLGYSNLDRIWIEKQHQEVREGRRTVEQSVFELHVVRTSDSGTAYEDTVDHLSESEREVTGLVFALAGYLVHEVYEQLPFMLLDSLEAIDSERIAALIDYLTDHTGYLIVALLPEDAAELPAEYERITEI